MIGADAEATGGALRRLFDARHSPHSFPPAAGCSSFAKWRSSQALAVSGDGGWHALYRRAGRADADAFVGVRRYFEGLIDNPARAGAPPPVPWGHG